MKRIIKQIQEDYKKYAQPKWWFWLSYIGLLTIVLIFIFGITYSLAFNNKDSFFYQDNKLIIFTAVFVFPVIIISTATSVLGHFIGKGKCKEFLVQQEEDRRIEIVRNGLKHIYIENVFNSDEHLLRQYRETSKNYKDIFIEIMFDSYIQNEENLEGLLKAYDNKDR